MLSSQMLVQSPNVMKIVKYLIHKKKLLQTSRNPTELRMKLIKQAYVRCGNKFYFS